MKLTSELISQFVKATNDEPQKKVESTVFARVTEDSLIVIDGSTKAMPIKNLSSTSVKPGDRVIVRIKDHTAVIIGNLTDPSANSASVGDIVDDKVGDAIKNSDTVTKIENEYIQLDSNVTEVTSDIALINANLLTISGEVTNLNSEVTNVKNLVAGKATIEDLEVERGRIDDLIAADVIIKDTLTANSASIEELKAEDADIRKLVATKADIVALDAALGRIATIESNHVTTAYLTSNYLTANDIQTTYLTATQIAAEYAKTETLNSNYAQINLANVNKADIGTVLANVGLISQATIVDGHVTGYLDSVEVNANKITAGTLAVDRLVISGTDKSIIYAINNSGDLTSTEVDTIDGDVITKRTITADHIIAGAITANELHSESVTSEKIAAGAVTAGKISVTSLESIVAKIGSFTINNALYTNNHSAYNSAVNGVYVGSDYISLGNGGKTWLKNDGSVSIGDGAIDYDATTKELNIVANSIEIGSETVAKMSDIDNISIGGRNLYLRTHIRGENTDYSIINYSFADPSKIVAGETYTISFDGMLSDPTQTDFYINVTPSPYNGCAIIPAISTDGTYQHYEATFVMPNNGSFIGSTIYARPLGSGKLAGVKNVKLEKGNKATDWTPAPEDVNTTINALADRVSKTETSITQNSEAIKLRVLSTEVDSKISTASTELESKINVAIDDIAIGGRNLLQWNNIRFLGGSSLASGNSTKEFTVIPNPNSSSGSGIMFNEEPFDPGTYTLNLKCNLKHNIRIISSAQIDGYDSIYLQYYDTAFGFPYYTDIPYDNLPCTFTIAESTKLGLVFVGVYDDNGGQFNHTISELKLEKGNKATDWTQAPEDVIIDSSNIAISAAQSTIDNITIGGRNLLPGYEEARHITRFFSIPTKEALQDYVGREIVVSFDAKLGENGVSQPILMYGYQGNGISIPSNGFYFTPTTAWQRFSFVTYVKDHGIQDETYTSGEIAFYDTTSNNDYYIRRVKIELGNKPTDWSPAPEDVDADIDALADSVSAIDERLISAESSITQLSNKITANVTETTNLGTRMTTIEQTADSLTLKLSNLEIGGRNFIIGSRDLNGTAATNYNGKTILSNGFTAFKCTGNWHGVKYNAKDLIINGKNGDVFTFSLNIKTSDICILTFYAMCYTADKQRVYPDCTSGQFNSMSVVTTNAAEEQDQRVHITFPVTQGWIDLINDGGSVDWTLQVHDGASSTNPAYLYAPKLERGNKPTDWTPAPEDIDSDVLNASKTATNYLNFSSSGLVIGDLTASTLGKNILIDSDSVDIRSGTDVRASFGEDYLYLAKHSRNATIDLCNGLATLYHASSTSYDTIFVIDTPNITKIRGTYNPLQVESTVSGKTAIQFANTSGVLGSIGMVESASGAMITRNVPSTASTYTVLDTGNYYTMMDSGWLTCAINTSGSFTVYDDGSNIKYRKIGKMVEVVGAVKPKTALSAGTTNYVFATLPSGYRPSLAITERCQGSSGYSWLFSITTGGDLRYSRYSNGSSCVDLPAQTWLPFHVTFFTN